jgi:hypothetical protein
MEPRSHGFQTYISSYTFWAFPGTANGLVFVYLTTLSQFSSAGMFQGIILKFT